MSENIVIDTQLWEFSYAIPKEEEFKGIHVEANIFVKEMLEREEVVICMNSYQICEVLEVFRKVGIGLEVRHTLLENFIHDDFKTEIINKPLIKSAFEKSFVSGIHGYDYLVVSFVDTKIDKIYSADQHFQHDHFKQIAPVINPLSEYWVVEGKKPYKKVERPTL